MTSNPISSCLDVNLRRYVISAFKSLHRERYYARIDWSVGAEIAAIVLIFLGHLVSVFLAFRQVQ